MGNLRIVEVLHQSGADVNAQDRWRGTALADAIREGHREGAHYLVSGGGHLNYDEETAAGMLCELAKQGDLDKVKLLLTGGCDANAADYDKRTCLHLGTCSRDEAPPLPRLNPTLASRFPDPSPPRPPDLSNSRGRHSGVNGESARGGGVA